MLHSVGCKTNKDEEIKMKNVSSAKIVVSQKNKNKLLKGTWAT